MEKIAVGVMSGTSLDGLDLALVKFSFDSKWTFELLDSRFIPYTICWSGKLKNAMLLPANELLMLHNEFGDFIGEKIVEFLKGRSIDLIASHGHTVFHQPEKKMTFQIGNGANIAASTGLKVINDFRTLDVALNGQGAPLVPVGDLLLFSEHQVCLNLGGFANVSVKEGNSIVAYDICPANIVLNQLANELGLPYDKNGKIASGGKVDDELLNQLNNLPFYSEKPPKSLGKEWVESNILPIINKNKETVENKIATFTQHIVSQIVSVMDVCEGKILVTGGGAYNQMIVESLKRDLGDRVEVPSSEIIDFKEAVLFAFLGVLRELNEKNCLRSVTGADMDNIGGAVWQG